MISIWERNSFTRYDHIIIGSGIVGLTTAYYLKQKFPHHSVIVLERGVWPAGASTKNAGFACMGSLTEIIEDIKNTSVQEAVALFMLRKKGLERLLEIVPAEKIGFRKRGSYELIQENEKEALQHVEAINQYFSDILPVAPFLICDHLIKPFGFEQVSHLIENTLEGELDTGLMMQQLIQKVLSLGIEIKTGCEVTQFVDNVTQVDIICKNPLTDTNIHLQAKQLFICTNAFAQQLLPYEDVTPGRGQVLISKPIKNMPLKGIFHAYKGYYYFREYNGCLLFGGGRHLDFETETTTLFELNKKIQSDLEEKIKTIILPNHNVEIDMRWTGIMAFGKTKRPIIKMHSANVFIGVRMGGMGVAIGSEVGNELKNMAYEF